MSIFFAATDPESTSLLTTTSSLAVCMASTVSLPVLTISQAFSQCSLSINSGDPLYSGLPEPAAPTSLISNCEAPSAETSISNPGHDSYSAAIATSVQNDASDSSESASTPLGTALSATSPVHLVHTQAIKVCVFNVTICVVHIQ